MDKDQELHKLIAEKIMKLPVDESGGTLWWRRRHTDRWNRVPEYSYSMSSAWEVVEQLNGMGYSFSCNGSGDDWEAEFNLLDGRFLQGSDSIGMGRSYSMPMAICLAALRTLKIDTSIFEERFNASQAAPLCDKDEK